MNTDNRIIKSLAKIRTRRIIQNAFFGIFMILLFLTLKGDVNNAHQFCPFAAVCFGAMVPFGVIAVPVGIGLGLSLLVLSIFIGRKFCSYACFLGTIQEKIFTFHKGKSKIKHIIPQKAHDVLKYTKYLILLATVILAVSFRQSLYMKYCPVLNLNFFLRFGISAAIFLSLFFLFSFLVERFWCKYLCPFAALQNLFQLLGKLFKIKRLKVVRNVPESLGCRNCANYCPMQIDLQNDDEIKSIECIHCQRCVRVCAKSKSEIAKCIYRDNIY